MKTLIRKILNQTPGLPVSLLPKVDGSAVLAAADYELKFLEPQVKDGNVSAYELFIINSLVKQKQPRKIFELGTFNGRTTLNLSANSSDETRIFTLDLPQADLQKTTFNLDQIEKKFVEKPGSGQAFNGRKESSKITQLFGDSAKFDFSPYQEQMDFVFVDASHAYEYVLNDSHVALKLLAPERGIILWHDYGRPQWWPGVTRALDELHKNLPPFASLVHIEGTSLACLMKD